MYMYLVCNNLLHRVSALKHEEVICFLNEGKIPLIIKCIVAAYIICMFIS